MNPNVPLTQDSREGICVARQPILNPAGQVFGYELLYRSSADGSAAGEEQDLASARVVSDAVLALGLDTLTGGRRAFLKMTRTQVLGNVHSLLPPKAVVIELAEREQVDGPLIDACRDLRARGYALALDEFRLDTAAAALVPYANFVKVVSTRSTSADWQAIRRAVPAATSLVATSVDSAQMYEAVRAGGFHLFQGYYFCKPTTFTAGALPGRRMAYAQLLNALSDPDVSVNRIEDLIKHDASLSYKVLRCVNSAAFGIQRQIQSIRQAVVLLGLDQVRKWASVWALAGLNEGSSSELVSLAILRARSCELIAQDLMSREEASEYFLLGMCSLLDVILQKPMAEAIGDLPLSDTVRKALLGEENLASFVLDSVLAYERGRWDEADRHARVAGFDPARLPAAFADALKWARELAHPARAA